MMIRTQVAGRLLLGMAEKVVKVNRPRFTSVYYYHHRHRDCRVLTSDGL
jgi:hypothetical protein